MTNVRQATRKSTRTGMVVSDKADKTITVSVDRLVLHPLFKKYIKRRTRFLVHDEKNESRLGDKVKIVETRPLSKNKRWRLVSILERKPI